MEKAAWYSELIKHAALIGLFILLPLLVAAGLGYHTIWLERDKHILQVTRKLEVNLAQITCETDSEIFIRKVARGAWHSVRQAGNDTGKLLASYRALQKFLPVDFDLYTFNERGELVTPVQIQLKSRFLGARLWEIINCSPMEQSRRFQRLRRQLKAFLGNEFRMAQFIEGRDSTSQIITNQRQGLVYWINDPAAPARGVLMIFWNLPDLNFRLGHVLKRMQKHFECGFIIADGNGGTQFGSRHTSSETSQEVVRKLTLLKQKNHFDEQGHVWGGRQIESLWAVAALKTGVERFDDSHNTLMLVLLLAAVLAMAVYFRFAGGARMFLPIRMKLLSLFLVAVISPVMGFAYLGYRYLADREATLLATVSNQSRKLMVSFDESFRNAGASFIDEFRLMGQSATSVPEPEVRRALESRIQSNDLIIYELRNASNAEVIFSLQNELVFEGMREVSDAFARFCLDNIFGSNLTDTIDPLLDMAVRSPEAGLWFFFSRPDKVHRMSFGPVPMFIFWKVLHHATSPSGVYVYILQSAARLTKRLMQSRLSESLAAQSMKPFTLAAFDNRSGDWLPAKVRDNRTLRDFADRLLFSDKPEETSVEIAGENYLVFGQRSKNAPGYSLFAFYPFQLIAEELSRLRRFILAAMLLFIAVAMLAALLLSDIFLLPVARLGDGVAAIKARNTDFRIEPVQHDEFGDLAISFNHMIADLKEMQLAQDVQESLLPAAPPVLEGYRLTFANRMASAVGGDYFDVLLLDRENIFVIIGDVTGHGVSSALVMAMAKAIVYHGLKESRDLISLFTDLNHAIHAYFSKPPVRKMITLFAATINLPTGKGLFANAGHNFPVQVSPDGRCEELVSVHMPIGAAKSLKKLVTREFEIGFGDTLVFYTDGLIEVTDARREQYGYEKFKEVLSANATAEPAEISRCLFAAYDGWLAGGEPDDDVTLVILNRLPVV